MVGCSSVIVVAALAEQRLGRFASSSSRALASGMRCAGSLCSMRPRARPPPGNVGTNADQRRRLVEEDTSQHGGDVVSDKRWPTSQALEQHAAQRKDVGGRRDLPRAVRLFRCHIGRRADQHAAARDGGHGQARRAMPKSRILILSSWLSTTNRLVGFWIAVHDVAAMRHRQGLGDAPRQSQVSRTESGPLASRCARSRRPATPSPGSTGRRPSCRVRRTRRCRDDIARPEAGPRARSARLPDARPRCVEDL